MRKYHVVLANGDERDVHASDVNVRDGVLSFINDEGNIAVAYAPGAWVAVELESRDDR